MFRPSASLPSLEKERLTAFDPTTDDRDKRGRLKSRAKPFDPEVFTRLVLQLVQSAGGDPTIPGAPDTA